MLDVAGGHNALIVCIDDDSSDGIFKHLNAKLLDVQDDLGNILLNTGNGRELVKHAINPDGGSGCSRQ